MTNSGVASTAAVVVAERDLAQRRHLACAHLVQDLAGAGVGVACRAVMACKRARRFRTPAAMAGSTHSICMAVMMPSRPKVVEYQGMPAYG